MKYSYNHPFVTESKKGDEEKYISEEYFNNQEVQLREFIKRYIRRHNLDAVDAIDENSNGFQYLVRNTNMRSLVDSDQFEHVLNVLGSRDEYIMTKLIELHSNIGVLFDHDCLDKIVNRTMRSISIIPYPIDDPDKLSSWGAIYSSLPIVWILIYMQALISI